MNIFRRQQNDTLEAYILGTLALANKLQEALEMEAHIKEHHVEAFSPLHNLGHHIKKSMGKGGRRG